VLTNTACSNFPELVFRGVVKVLEIRYRIDPRVRRGWIDSLPFVVYLPSSIFGVEPVLKVKYLSKGEQIGFEHSHEIEIHDTPRTLHVAISEESLDPGWEARAPTVNTSRGRAVSSRSSGGDSKYYLFAIDGTLIHVQVYVSSPDSPGLDPYPLGGGELERFVDSFDPVERSAVYRIPDAEEAPGH
jgi:hypothetical protein